MLWDKKLNMLIGTHGELNRNDGVTPAIAGARPPPAMTDVADGQTQPGRVVLFFHLPFKDPATLDFAVSSLELGISREQTFTLRFGRSASRPICPFFFPNLRKGISLS